MSRPHAFGFHLAILFMVAAAVSSAQSFKTLLSFDGPNGYDPMNALVQGTDGNLYGMADGGGVHGYGTFFKVSREGNLTTLYSFEDADGFAYKSVLIQATDGNFYGVAAYGGTGFGSILKFTPSGTLTVLYNFGVPGGSSPFGWLVQRSDGDFYGTTSGGGPDDAGTVYEITPSGILTTLHAFDRTDGLAPMAGLVQAPDGNFYGTTAYGGGKGGDLGGGTVFKITPFGVLTVLHSFDGKDGGHPFAGLVYGVDGNLYGTTNNGGANHNFGTVFKIAPDGTLTTLHSFDGIDGNDPTGGLFQATDGNFYGTTLNGGASGDGTIFEITPGGTFTTLYSFCSRHKCADGSSPYAGLIQSTDGNFYGATYFGGTGPGGTFFRLTTGLGPFVEIQPSVGSVGTSVTILGTDLAATTSVSFDGTPATFTIVSPTEILTSVPAGATSGAVKVTSTTGSVRSNAPFRVRE